MINKFAKWLDNVTSKTSNVVRKDGWMNPLNGMGVYGNDKAASICFRACPIFSWIELGELYRADGLTKRIIEVVASDMMREGWQIEGDGEDLIAGKLEELNGYAKLTELIQLSRLYGGAIIVLGIADGRALDEPVNLDNIQDIKWMRLFDRYQTNIDTTCICVDLNNENYAHPDFYQVNDYRTGATFIVHHSRVLRMDWSMLTPRQANWNQGWGDSVILSIYSELKNYGAAFANTSTIMQDFVTGLLKIPGLSQSIVSSCGEQALYDRLNLSNITRGTANTYVIDALEDYQKLTTNVAGLSDLLDRFMLSVSSVTGIPVTLLFGRAPSGMNATGEADTRNYYDMIKQYQEFKLKPVLEKLITYIMASKNGPLGGVIRDNWNIQFTPLWQVTEEQEAITKKITAETDAIYIDRGVLDSNEVAISRFGGDRYSTQTHIDIEARQNGYDPDEVAKLEAEKLAQNVATAPDPTNGPDDFPSDNRGVFIV